MAAHSQDYLQSAVDLFAAAVSVDDDGDVDGVDVDDARYAIELARLAGIPVKPLLEPHRWAYYPKCILGIVVGGDELERECRVHAVWCALRVRRLWPTDHRGVLYDCLIVAIRHARGSASDSDLAAAEAAAWAAARDAAWGAARDAARDAAWGAAAAARGAAWGAARGAQNARLIQRVRVLLERAPLSCGAESGGAS